ncbi:MAG: hypothetical protein HYR96_06470 [Deltaproteobacteria bacterium]|nr:hypothetical protein [Deltaproteobacteria bacterium]MBI3295869.1 hypothetical protein [Deltaproteobacteria bacterium]
MTALGVFALLMALFRPVFDTDDDYYLSLIPQGIGIAPTPSSELMLSSRLKWFVGVLFLLTAPAAFFQLLQFTSVSNWIGIAAFCLLMGAAGDPKKRSSQPMDLWPVISGPKRSSQTRNVQPGCGAV